MTAIAVAKQQGTRSFELRAALSLAKLYQSTGRPAEAHAVLAPALEGFSPTPELPEIAEAQALLTALAETDEVKAVRRSGSAALRPSNGLRPSSDFGPRASLPRKPGPPSLGSASWESASRKDAEDDLYAYYAQCYERDFVRGEIWPGQRNCRDLSARMPRRKGALREADVTRRMLGLTFCSSRGDVEAREPSLNGRLDYLRSSARGRDASLFDCGHRRWSVRRPILALTEWHLGRVSSAPVSLLTAQLDARERKWLTSQPSPTRFPSRPLA